MKRNRELVPNVAELVDEVRSWGFGGRLIHGVDHETGYEIGRAGADRLTTADMTPRRLK